MKHVHLDNIPWFEWASTTGKFQGAGREISEALGAVVGATLDQGGHPFDLELGRLAPGKSGCPFHRHSAQWECYTILSGSGVMRHGDQRRDLGPGDVALHPPGSSHQLINTGETDLLYYLVADNPLTEFCYYPDSHKWGVVPGGIILQGHEVHYDLGEDDSPETAVPPSTRLPLPEIPAQFLNIADLEWGHRHSPKSKFSSYCRDISINLGGKRNTDAQNGGHPFDLQIRRIAPSAAICPYHSHSMQWELLVFLSGRGTVRTPSETIEVGKGDIVLHPPGTPHQTRAAADTELECLIIADNPKEDTCYYPDSDKWGVLSIGRYFRRTDTEYYDGEE